VPLGIDVVLGDGQRLVKGLLSLDDDEGGHELGNGGDGQYRFRIFAKQHLATVLIEHQRCARLERQRITCGSQAGSFSERGTRHDMCSGR
jgi:hypothetical protein